MKIKTKVFSCLVLLLNVSAFAAADSYTYDCVTAEELRMRDGIPNFFVKIQSEKEIRIAYLGGSITEANGWRVKTMAWFKQQYPKARFVEINAAISGTGSDFSACRLDADVLPNKPDLVFLECRVNGGGGFERESVEGVVRQIWRDNPQTDICLIYTISLPMLKDIQAGKTPGFGRKMETIANHYGIPSIDLGVEIAKLEKEGKLTFKAAEPEQGKILFSKDGTHPGDEGHQIYGKIIARSMLKMQSQANVMKHTLGEPLDQNCWETASLLPVNATELSAGWVSVDEEDVNYNVKRTKDMLRKAVKCNQIGETITVRWNGTTVGFSDIPCGDGMVVEAVIDGKQPITMERKQTAERKNSRFWYLPAQSPGDHEVRYTIKQLPAGESFYAGQFLIVGTPIKR
ncbi:MAG: SGNH/GDSL hydrolase family protein [Kiritimatiellaceae bacterium]|nr:SGNH/GDSL hydrolase family protein [Kiritimatiellaceae bacterium]